MWPAPNSLIRSLSKKIRPSQRRKLQGTCVIYSKLSTIVTLRTLYIVTLSQIISWLQRTTLCASLTLVCQKLREITVSWQPWRELLTTWHQRSSKVPTVRRPISGHLVFFFIHSCADTYLSKAIMLLRFSERSKRLTSTSITESSKLSRTNARIWLESCSFLIKRRESVDSKRWAILGSRNLAMAMNWLGLCTLVVNRRSATMSSPDYAASKVFQLSRKQQWTCSLRQRQRKKWKIFVLSFRLLIQMEQEWLRHKSCTTFYSPNDWT